MTNAETPTPPGDLYNPYLYSASALALDGLLRLAGNYELEVWHKLPDGQAGILAPKHAGVLDIPLLGAATRRVYNRNIRFIAKNKLVQNYPHSDKVRNYFDHMGGIIFNQSLPIDQQPGGPQLERDIANQQLITAFLEGEVVPGRKIGKTDKIGPTAIKYLTPVQAVGIAGTEGNRRDWLSRKVVVYGSIATPVACEFDPDNKRPFVEYAKAFSAEVHAMMQTANDRAHQLHSRTTVPVSGRWR